VRRQLAHRLLLGPEDGGCELHPLIGWKAANLAEVEQLGDHGRVPPWFAVTEHAFNDVLDAPLDRVGPATDGSAPAAYTLRTAIDAITARSDLDPGQKSAEIRQLWDRVALPRKLIDDVVAAYRRLADPAPQRTDRQQGRAEPRPDLPAVPAGPFVAVRSSGLEEDAESAARAGEFDTFLFIRGEDQLLTHLKRAWSGLWTERAIHNRAVFGPDSERPRGGVIVQRMIDSRVSGVLQTVNLVEGELREMVINAGLGLGEGIVSGRVAADQVVVAKGDDGNERELRFRYLTSDKRSQVVFNHHAGFGTALTETLYHQRLRPALEYVELRELVEVAAHLEIHYGYPLDIEFAIEGTRLWILQVRPLAVYLPVLRETLEESPLFGPQWPTAALPHEESSHDPT
jgi:pyruvate,water dikinase